MNTSAPVAYEQKFMAHISGGLAVHAPGTRKPHVWEGRALCFAADGAGSTLKSLF